MRLELMELCAGEIGLLCAVVLHIRHGKYVRVIVNVNFFRYDDGKPMIEDKTYRHCRRQYCHRRRGLPRDTWFMEFNH